LRLDIIYELEFLWDKNKNEINKKKHHISFESATFVFRDPNYVDIFDELHSNIHEERHIIIGLVEEVLFVVCVFYNDTTRIISVRYANEQEKRIYYGR